MFRNYACDNVTMFLNINNPFIHQADVNVLIFKHLMMTTMDESILTYILNALSHPVVTSEVRIRSHNYTRLQLIEKTLFRTTVEKCFGFRHVQRLNRVLEIL